MTGHYAPYACCALFEFNEDEHRGTNPWKTNLGTKKLPPRSSLQGFRLHIFESLLASMKMRCQPHRRHAFAALASCGLLVPTTDIHRINDSSYTIDCLRGCLDNCGRHGDDWESLHHATQLFGEGSSPNFRRRIPLMSLCASIIRPL